MRDLGLDALLDLDGTRFVLDEAGIYWVKFDISACAVSPERPNARTPAWDQVLPDPART